MVLIDDYMIHHNNLLVVPESYRVWVHSAVLDAAVNHNADIHRDLTVDYDHVHLVPSAIVNIHRFDYFVDYCMKMMILALMMTVDSYATVDATVVDMTVQHCYSCC